jgi:hypothetical protein
LFLFDLFSIKKKNVVGDAADDNSSSIRAGKRNGWRFYLFPWPRAAQGCDETGDFESLVVSCMQRQAVDG